jgi:hypothetical protein
MALLSGLVCILVVAAAPQFGGRPGCGSSYPRPPIYPRPQPYPYAPQYPYAPRPAVPYGPPPPGPYPYPYYPR